MAGGQARPTLRTLALDLGVSRSTVSNAFNRPDQLSADLRTRILSRAEELGFVGPDPMARGLRRGRVGAVGVLVDESLSYAFSDPATVLFLDGLAREVESEGLGLLLHAGVGSAEQVRHVRDAVVDAWVVQSLPDGHPSIAAALSRGRPVVVLDQPALPGVPRVGIDDFAGAAAAVRHLVGLGHRRLGVLSMPLRPDGRSGPADVERQAGGAYRVIRQRLAGAAQAAEQAGLDWSAIPVLECANTGRAGAAAMLQLLSAPEPPTAVFALSDEIAVGALRAAVDAGVAVPDQLSMVGFDDSPAARAAEPALTTVAQPLLERGQAVGSLVRALLAGRNVPEPVPYRTRLVVRASTAAASRLAGPHPR